METKLTKEEKQQIALRILADVYSCLKVVYKMNVDNLDSDVLIKVLVNHFNLSVFETENVDVMTTISFICYPIAHEPLKYFNFSYRKPNR
jgi:hypothetical protein